MKKPTVYVNPVYPQPERQTGTIWEQATKKKRAKYLIYKYLAPFIVPRPAFEIIKVGKMWVKRKTQKNTAI